MSNGLERFAPLMGIVFVVLLFASFFVIGEEPPSVSDDSAQEIAEFYDDKSGQIYGGAVLFVLAAFALLVYGSSLRNALREAEGDRGIMPTVAFAGLIILVTGGAIDNTISIALTETADDVEPSAVQALAALWENDFIPFSLGIFTFLMATGLSIVRHGALPKWMGWIAIVTSPTAISPAFPVAAIAALLLLIISGVILYRRGGSGTPAAPAAPSA